MGNPNFEEILKNLTPENQAILRRREALKEARYQYFAAQRRLNKLKYSNFTTRQKIKYHLVPFIYIISGILAPTRFDDFVQRRQSLYQWAER